MPDHPQPHLAFDLGAESGRAVLGRVRSGVLSIEEVHRFANEPVEYGGSIHWDVPRLWFEMRKAFSMIEEQWLGGVGVDAWGVDYALLGQHGELIENPYHYRDRRTEGAMEAVLTKLSKQEIYRRTGIQFMPINTLYQLFAAQRDSPELLRAAHRLVTIPDLFHFWMSGTAVCEFTNATTTQMLDPVQRAWCTDMLQALDLPAILPAPLVDPGTVIGKLRASVAGSKIAGTSVIAPACHDTGSAVAAVSARDGTAFISSGTWSLVGTELDSPLITDEALRLNFTNEGGVCGTTRFLKNVMGLWMLQGCRQSWANAGKTYEYAELMDLATQEPAFAHLIDPDDESFLRPTDMLNAIDQFCRRTQQPVPKSPGAYARAVLEGLAFKYHAVIDDLERLTGNAVRRIRVIGGGSRNQLLNQFTADATGRTVIAGPVEATALGNIAVQLLATGEISSLTQARAMIESSFSTQRFQPRETDQWQAHAQRFRQYCETTYA